MNNAISYHRTSPKPSKAEERSSSIPTQQDATQNYASREGFTVAPEHAFDDVGVSARKTPFRERPEGARASQLLISDGPKHIIAYDLTRLFRNVTDGCNTLEEWSLAGVRVHLASQGLILDTSSPHARLIVHMLLSVAEFEGAQIAWRMQNANDFKRKNGKLTSSKTPYGKMRLGKGLELVDCPEEQRVIAVIRSLKRKKVLAICRELDTMGFTKRNGSDWCNSTGRRIVTEVLSNGS